MKGTHPMSPTERTRKRRQRLEQAGGRLIQVALSPDSAARLDQLVEQHGSITQAVEFALQSAVRE